MVFLIADQFILNMLQNQITGMNMTGFILIGAMAGLLLQGLVQIIISRFTQNTEVCVQFLDADGFLDIMENGFMMEQLKLNV